MKICNHVPFVYRLYIELNDTQLNLEVSIPLTLKPETYLFY